MMNARISSLLRRWSHTKGASVLAFGLALALALPCLMLLAGPARADGAVDFATALRGISQSSTEAVAQSITALGATEDPRALKFLESLDNGDVVVDAAGGVFVRDSAGALHDPATGAPANAPDAHPLVVDNGIRRVLGPTLSRLELRSPDSATRLKAVEDLASNASTDDAAALRDALAQEKVASVHKALVSALAELDLASDDPKQRLGAIAAIDAEGSERLRPKLEALIARHDDGSFGDPDPNVRAAAEKVVKSLQRKQLVFDTTADVLYGLSMGSILLLSSLGLAITFGLMRVINMAHGEMLMLGAYATYATQTFFHAHLPEHESWYLLAAVPVALVSTMAVGALLERTVIRFLYGRPLETLLATYGLSLLLIQIVRTIFGAQNVAVENPPFLSGGAEIFEGVVVPYNRIAVVLFTIVVVSFVGYVLRGTSLGLRVRAVTQNRPMAACMGIRTEWVDMWTFALGSGVGGLGGVAISQLGNVGPDLGQSYIVDSFLVVVLGGVGKLIGSVFAAFSLGILNKLLEPVAGAVLGKIIVLMVVVLVIQKRPQGLFAPKGRTVESA
jgi:urea transport system permease protein